MIDATVARQQEADAVRQSVKDNLAAIRSASTVEAGDAILAAWQASLSANSDKKYFMYTHAYVSPYNTFPWYTDGATADAAGKNGSSYWHYPENAFGYQGMRVYAWRSTYETAYNTAVQEWTQRRISLLNAAAVHIADAVETLTTAVDTTQTQVQTLTDAVEVVNDTVAIVQENVNIVNETVAIVAANVDLSPEDAATVAANNATVAANAQVVQTNTAAVQAAVSSVRAQRQSVLNSIASSLASLARARTSLQSTTQNVDAAPAGISSPVLLALAAAGIYLAVK